MNARHVRFGDGPRTVVMLHGFLGSHRNLRTLARRWADETLSLHLLDLMGHGHGPPFSEGADLDAVARELAVAVVSHGATLPVSVVGHSLGGLVAIAWAGARPADVDRVVLLDIAPGSLAGPSRAEDTFTLSLLLAAPASAGSREEMRAKLFALSSNPDILSIPRRDAHPRAERLATAARGPSDQDLVATIDWLLTNLERSGRDYVWRFDRGALAGFRRRLEGLDLWWTVERRAVPVDCIRGSASPFVTRGDVERLENAGANVVTIEGGDHNLHTSKTDEVVAALRNLFRPG